MTPPEQRAGIATEVEPDPTPGRRLREAREAANLSLAEVASQLHLERRAVELLERDEYDKLHAPAFVRGYLSSYARLLHLPARPIVEAYDRRGFGPPALVPDIAQRPQVRVGDLPVRVVTYLIAAMLVLLVFLWWQSRQAPLEEGPLAGGEPSELASAPPPAGDAHAARASAETFEPARPATEAVSRPPGTDVAGGQSPPPVTASRAAPTPAETRSQSPGESAGHGTGRGEAETLAAGPAPAAGGHGSPAPSGDSPGVAATMPEAQTPAGAPAAPQERLAEPPVETPAPALDAAGAARAGRAPDAEAAMSQTPEPVPGESPPAATASEPRMAAAAPQASAPRAAAAAPGSGDDVLRMDFSRPSWVEVYDRHGDRLYYSLANQGSEILIRGAGPMRVLLGDVEGANVAYNGEPFELDVYSGRKVARFVVGEGTPAPARRPAPPASEEPAGAEQDVERATRPAGARAADGGADDAAGAPRPPTAQ